MVSVVIIIVLLLSLAIACKTRASIMNWIRKRERRREIIRLDPITQEYLRLTKYRNEEL